MKAPACNSSAPGRPFMERALTGALMALALASAFPARSSAAERQENKPGAKVSYYREIRPILQANCQGCHQPAKNKGGYVMTDFKRLLAGGDNEGAAIVPRHAEQSSILKM